MTLIKKSKTALRILRTRGLKGVLDIIYTKLDRSFRPDESQMVFNLLVDSDPTGLMIDVGAHHGSSLALFAEHGWQVLAFEPDSQNRSKLSDAFSAYNNIIIDPRACSDRVVPQATLYASAESTGVSGLTPFLDSHHASENVSVTTLTAALEEHQLSATPVDFLKIDTEGFDLMVLKGYPWQTASHPQAILCEFENAKTVPLGYNFHDLAKYLTDLGYKLIISEWYPVKTYGRTHRWRGFATYPCQLADPKGWGNIFAIKDQDCFAQLSRLCNLD
jgi:FkbM family methyltransferase